MELTGVWFGMITSLQWGMVHLFGFLPKHAFMAIHHFLNVLGRNVLESVIGIVLKFHFQVKSQDQARMIDCFEMLVHVHASSSISCHPSSHTSHFLGNHIINMCFRMLL